MLDLIPAGCGRCEVEPRIYWLPRPSVGFGNRASCGCAFRCRLKARKFYNDIMLLLLLLLLTLAGSFSPALEEDIAGTCIGIVKWRHYAA